MTDEITIPRCALCGKSFSYVPSDDDNGVHGARNQICDACYEEHEVGVQRDEIMAQAHHEALAEKLEEQRREAFPPLTSMQLHARIRLLENCCGELLMRVEELEGKPTCND